MNENILRLLDELSFLSRETKGASFTIQHLKDSGKYKVVFPNVMVYSKHKLRETDFETAIHDAIEWIKNERRSLDIPEEKYTLFSS